MELLGGSRASDGEAQAEAQTPLLSALSALLAPDATRAFVTQDDLRTFTDAIVRAGAGAVLLV